MGRGGCARFPTFRLDGYGRMDGRTDGRPERAWGRMDGWMDKQMEERKSPCVLQDFVPFEAADLLPLTQIHIHARQGNGYR